ncbi:MAG TPA: PAS domain S-box protein, partial [Candidatus Baltobacteraceae bacterium]|nr:PAS domain S-box protein [Candidatus Baltobacteraceae bacterium]
MELYERLVRSTSDAVIAADSTGRIVLCNDAAEAMFGYPCGFLTGKRASTLIPDALTPVYEENFAAAIQAGKTREEHISLVGKHADGHEFPVEVAVSIDKDGDDVRAFGIVRKVDERFEKLALLGENERRLRNAENLASVGSFEWDVATGTLTWSDELYRMFGCDPVDCPSTFEAFLARIHPEQRESVARKVRLAVESGTGWTMDEHIVRLDTGEVRTLLSKVRAMRDADGNITRLCGTCQDVTEQRRAEYALAASESRFRRSFDYAAVGMMMVELTNGDGVILRMNNALAQLLGIAETSYTGMTLAELVVSDDWPLLHTILDRVVHDGSSGQVEVRLCGAGGKRPMVYASAARIGDAESPRSVLVHIQDITERKAAEEQLRHRALHDPLTGLPNRTLLLDRLDLALARAERAEASVAVLFLDVDNFKLINDTIGHAAGDHMLRAIAKRIVDAGRIGDTAARV